METRFDTIVVGVGGMGSATCYELAKRGQKVLGLEQFDIPHAYGSSHGLTRIIRMAYFEGSSYVPLLKRGFELWEEIEQLEGAKIFHKTGGLDIGLPGSPVFSGSVASCNFHQLDHEVLSADEVMHRYPAYRIPADYVANYQPDAGFLLSEKAIIAYVTAAQNMGAVIHAREKVVDWQATADGVIVKTNKGQYEAGKLIFTAGAWNRNLLPELQTLAVPERQVLAWLQPSEPAHFAPDNFPVFVINFEQEEYYGFPIYGVPGFKFGKFRHRREEGDPESFDRQPDDKDEQVLRSFSSKVFPTGNGPTMSLKTCMFTNTPDRHFIIDKHPEHANVIMAAGFSGHGFKFVSVVGEILADLACNDKTAHDIRPFELGRFQ